MKSHIHERILLYKIQRGDTESFGTIYDFYHERIYRYVYLKVPTQEDAQDITADTFLRAWQYMQEKKAIRALQAFLYQIARNLIVDFYRKRGSVVDSLDEHEVIVADRGDLSLEEKMILKSDIEQVERAIRQLKDVYRDVVILHYLNDVPLKNIARLIEKSQGATRVILHRAVKTLRDTLALAKG
ncbi:RNA polymerase sigma factor [Candidatus Uhrbacteria bacterium]|nr:RNA polymerase sigma factor [Candidatus Uhrbacteria bacterium]